MWIVELFKYVTKDWETLLKCTLFVGSMGFSLSFFRFIQIENKSESDNNITYQKDINDEDFVDDKEEK